MAEGGAGARSTHCSDHESFRSMRTAHQAELAQKELVAPTHTWAHTRCDMPMAAVKNRWAVHGWLISYLVSTQ
jgi:hypothetical protein